MSTAFRLLVIRTPEGGAVVYPDADSVRRRRRADDDEHQSRIGGTTCTGMFFGKSRVAGGRRWPSLRMGVPKAQAVKSLGEKLLPLFDHRRDVQPKSCTRCSFRRQLGHHIDAHIALARFG